jgi:hypothetical protein
MQDSSDFKIPPDFVDSSHPSSRYRFRISISDFSKQDSKLPLPTLLIPQYLDALPGEPGERDLLVRGSN